MSLRGKREELELKIQFRVDGANTALKKKKKQNSKFKNKLYSGCSIFFRK